MKTRFFLPFATAWLVSAATAGAAPTASYADTAHAARYVIHIDTLDYTAKTLRGWTETTLVTQVQNPGFLRLSLLKMTVDSVFLDNVPVVAAYDDTTLSVPVGPLNAGDTVTVRVHYQGAPQTDASGWGGFYFSGTTAFNLGVGFAADPHNLGKVWFPCIDVFDDKALYEFYITTPAAYKAFCNGLLAGQVTHPNGTVTWHWQMDDPIPSYLACMAVAPFTIKESDYNGIPVQFACFDSDTNNINATFQHLDDVMDAYSQAWGPYPFDKIGYTLVPFNSGAMEHASAIAIGRAFINGTLAYETLWAHELSHMWWGDKVTCRTAADMWLNEGWATYNEAFATQQLYGNQAYRDWILANHHKVLQFAHVPQNDGAYLAMNAIPQDHTYGMHAYQKGADMVHMLRGYLGDTSFFQGCQYYLNNRAYQNASSEDLRDDLAAVTGVNMNRFFDDWIFTPGWGHFSIDSVVYWPGGLDHYFVYTRQRSRGNNHLYEMPVQLTFSDGMNDTTVKVVIDSATNVFHIPLVGVFSWVALDRYGKVSDAIVDYERTVTAPGTYVMNETGCTITVANAGTGGSTLRVQHHYVTPDGFKQSNPGIRISDYHYYQVEGVPGAGMAASASLAYDGSPSVSTGFLDNTLITGTEDSLVLLYRAGTGEDWQEVNGYTLVTGPNHNDKRGTFTVDTLKLGEYVFGYYDYTVGTGELPGASGGSALLTATPNPSTDSFSFTIGGTGKAVLTVFDARGAVVYTTPVENPAVRPVWVADSAAAGLYFVSLFRDGQRVASVRLVRAD